LGTTGGLVNLLHQPIIVIEALRTLTPEFVVIDPDVVTVRDGYSVGVNAVVDTEVAHNYIAGFVDLQTKAIDGRIISEANDRRVVSNLSPLTHREIPFDVDDLWCIALKGTSA
jgi:hypothetical protein